MTDEIKKLGDGFLKTSITIDGEEMTIEEIIVSLKDYKKEVQELNEKYHILGRDMGRAISTLDKKDKIIMAQQEIISNFCDLLRSVE